MTLPKKAAGAEFGRYRRCKAIAQSFRKCPVESTAEIENILPRSSAAAASFIYGCLSCFAERKMRLSRLLPHSLVKDFISITYEDAVRRRLITPFIAFVAFLVSFTLTRAIAHIFPTVNFLIGKYHIHHFYYGIALLIASNWITLISNRQGPKLFAAGLFGLGLGILADEVGLLLTCTSPLTLQCNYHARITLDTFIIIAAFFMSVLYFVPAWRRFKMLVAHTHRLVYGKIKE